MKKWCFYILVAFIIWYPSYSYAMELVGEEVKYLKTYEYITGDAVSSNGNYLYSVQTYEITEEEYESASRDEPDMILGTTTINTEYKKMTTRLYANGLYYRYEVDLFWKKLPKVRSYDIIAIGHYGSVKVSSQGVYFNQEACTTSTNCTTYNTNYPQTFVSGYGTSFKLPTGSLFSLEQKLFFNATKTDPNSTVISQRAAGDYAHAVKTVTLATSKKYTVNYGSGIDVDATITSSYDTINAAVTTWSGTW